MKQPGLADEPENGVSLVSSCILRLPLKMSFRPHIKYGVNFSRNPETLDITGLPFERKWQIDND